MLFIKKLLDQDVNTSLGTVLNLQPFIIAYATDREMSLYLCKLCLNVRLLFDVLMAKARKDNDEIFDSITNFSMNESTCTKSKNGYHQWKCWVRLCSACKKSKPAKLKCQISNEVVSVDQFGTVEQKKLNKSTNVMEELPKSLPKSLQKTSLTT